MKLPVCPYCGRRISYFKMLILKTNCDYICPRCKRESKISVKSDLKYPFFIFLGISGVMILINMANRRIDSFWLLAISFLPMVVFYGLIPFFIKLKPYLKYKEVVRERLKNHSAAAKTKRKGAR